MNCTEHPLEPISGTCDRCGNFVCRLDSDVQPNGRTLCVECKKLHGEVDWLRNFKLELWGKRDAYAWLFGGLGFLYVAIAFATALVGVLGGAPSTATGVLLAVLVGMGGVQIAYFFGQRWAREAMIILPLISCFANVALATAATGGSPNGTPIFGIILPLAAYFDTRNKLFFKIDVPDDKLLKLWDRLRNNQLARTGFACGLLGLLIPGLGVIGLVLSLIGLARVNPDAVPPVGKKGYAIAGIVLSAIGTVLWAVVIIMAAIGK